MLKRFAMFFLAMMLVTSSAFAATYTVGSGAGDDYATITAAMADVNVVAGDVLVVTTDIADNATVDIGVTIMGEGDVTLTAAAPGTIITVALADDSENVIIQGLTFELANGDIAINTGTESIDAGSLTISGNNFQPAAAGNIGIALEVTPGAADIVNNLTFAGNMLDGSSVEIAPTNDGALLETIKIYANVFENANGITLDLSGADLSGNPAFALTTLDIKGNNFGNISTSGNTYYAFQVNAVDAEVDQQNINFNYNTVRYTYASGGGGDVSVISLDAGNLDPKIDATLNYWGNNAGPATTLPASGTGLGSVDAGDFTYTNYLTSSTALPNFTLAETHDADDDGFMDAIKLTIDNFIDPASLSTTGISVAGYNLSKNPRIAVDGDYFSLTVYVDEADAMDTGAAPVVAYTGTGWRSLANQSIASFTLTSVDDIAPHVVTAVTRDVDSNGKIDRLIVTFSETMKTMGGGIWSGAIDDGLGNAQQFGANPAGGKYNIASAVQSSNVVTFTLTEYVPGVGDPLYDTDYTPQFRLNRALPLTSLARDLQDNPVATITMNADDGAAPVAVGVTTADSDKDGYIDRFLIDFSETVNASGSGTSSGANARITVSTVENSISIGDNGTATTPGGGGTTLTVTGVNNKTTQLTSLHPWDTDATPEITMNSPVAAVVDANDNQWTAFIGGVSTIVSEDGANPVLVQAEGMQGTNDLYLTFSEPVSGSGDAINDDYNLIIAANLGITYHDNGAAGGVTGLATGDFVQDANGTDAIVVVNANGTFSARDFDSSTSQGTQNPDDIEIAATANVTDVAGNTLVTLPAQPAVGGVAQAGLVVIVFDVTAPTIDRVRTKDLDMDGWVDHIYVRFTEPIIDAGVQGYTNGQGINTAAAQYIAVEGYTVVGINNLNTGNWLNNQGNIVYSNWDDATTAAGPNVAVNADGRAILPTETAAVAGLTSGGDSMNDNTMWIMVAEQSDTTNVAGDTDATPAVTILGDTANGVRFADKKLNYVATVTDRTADDYAPPAIMSAAMQSFYVMNVAFSESLANPQVFSQNALTGGPDFTLLYGSGQSDISQSVNSIEFGSSNEQLVFNFMDSTPIEYGKAVMVAFNKTGAVVDPAGRGNNQVDDNWNAAAEATGENGSFITASVKTVGNDLRPGSLAVRDYIGDNGYYAIASFAPATNPDVRSYQFFLRDSNNMYNQIGDAAPGYIETDGKMYYLVRVPENGTINLGVRGFTGDALSSQRNGTGVVVAGKVGNMTVVDLLDDAAAKAAPQLLASNLRTASTVVIDNLGFAPIRNFSISDAPGADAGILLTWMAPPDHEANATGYEILRRVAGSDSDFFKVAELPIGTTQYVHKIKDSATAYEYFIRTVDDNRAHQLDTAIRTVISYAGGGDFNSNGTVDFADFSLFAQKWQTSAADDPTGFISAYDLSGDGVVNFADFSAFASQFGQTAGSAAKLATSVPTTDIAFDLAAEIDEASSMYYVTVSVDQAVKGLSYSLAYDTSALEFVDSSVSGLSGLHLVSETDGMVQVVAEFVGEQFDGAITLGFKSKGVESDLDFDVVNGMIDNGAVMASTKLGSVSLKAVPTVYALSQNFPNPFNPTTTIEYQIPQSGYVELAVYNMAGQKVRTLVSETQNASFYKAVWDGRNDSGEAVASGLYFYKLVSGNFSKIEKMTLLK